MIVEHLRETLDWLLKKESELNIQNLLVEFFNALANLSSSPQNQGYQTSVASTHDQLAAAIKRFETVPTAYESERMREIGAEQFFSQNIISAFRESLSANSMTPSVALSEVNSFVEQRGSYLETITSIRRGLSLIGVNSYLAEEGKAELGFTLPRSYFNDDLDGLIKKLRGTKYLIDTISEIEGGAASEIKIKSISTSNPIFYFGVDLRVAIGVACCFTWALDQWKKVEDIRKLRAETKKQGSFTDEDLKAFFDDKIKGIIESEVSAEVSRRLSENPTGRQAELATKFGQALEAVLAMIERGVTLELRHTPGEDEEEGSKEDLQSERAIHLEKALRFPAMTPQPMLQVPAQFNGDGLQPKE